MSWAELSDQSTPEAKNMIVSKIIESVNLKKDYEMDINLNISYQDYMSSNDGVMPEDANEKEMPLKQA